MKRDRSAVSAISESGCTAEIRRARVCARPFRGNSSFGSDQIDIGTGKMFDSDLSRAMTKRAFQCTALGRGSTLCASRLTSGHESKQAFQVSMRREGGCRTVGVKVGLSCCTASDAFFLRLKQGCIAGQCHRSADQQS